MPVDCCRCKDPHYCGGVLNAGINIGPSLVAIKPRTAIPGNGAFGVLLHFPFGVLEVFVSFNSLLVSAKALDLALSAKECPGNIADQATFVHYI